MKHIFNFNEEKSWIFRPPYSELDVTAKQEKIQTKLSEQITKDREENFKTFLAQLSDKEFNEYSDDGRKQVLNQNILMMDCVYLMLSI
jgi:hypothetical protein